MVVRLSASLIGIVKVIWLVSINIAEIHVQAYVVLMRIAKSSITFQCVLVYQDIPEIRLELAK